VVQVVDRLVHVDRAVTMINRVEVESPPKGAGAVDALRELARQLDAGTVYDRDLRGARRQRQRSGHRITSASGSPPPQLATARGATFRANETAGGRDARGVSVLALVFCAGRGGTTWQASRNTAEVSKRCCEGEQLWCIHALRETGLPTGLRRVKAIRRS
jgi:hypothetical protein